MPTQHLSSHLLEITLDRSRALGDELTRIKLRQYPPTGPKRLIDLAILANNRISQDISSRLSSSTSLPSTPDRRIEIFLRAKTSLLSILHLLMQCVEGADIQDCPVSFIVPIRSMLTRQLQSNTTFDFIAKASRAYNYMIWSIHNNIKNIFLEAGYEDLILAFPDLFFIIECPMSERRNIPIHCIFAHEIGHVLYDTAKLANNLLPIILSPRDTPDKQLIKASWVEELAADSIALCIYGPAYLYSFIYFAGPFCATASDTHPPDNLRIQLMCRMLINGDKKDGLAYKNTLCRNNNLEYVKQWLIYASHSVKTQHTEAKYKPLIPSIRSKITYIMREAKKLTQNGRYTSRKYSKDIPELIENIAYGIPPNEIIDFQKGKRMSIKAESILNAGWAYLISGDMRYAQQLGVQDASKQTKRLFNLVSKSLEYSELQERWRNKQWV
jgi:hypothetical protein